MQLMITSSHKTESLDKGTRALQLLWNDVEDDIEDQFDAAEDLDDKIILIQVSSFPVLYNNTKQLVQSFPFLYNNIKQLVQSGFPKVTYRANPSLWKWLATMN